MLASRAATRPSAPRASAPRARAPAAAPRRNYASHHKLPHTPQEAIAYGKQHGAQIIDCRFTDLHGTEHHIQFPMTQVRTSPLIIAR